MKKIVTIILLTLGLLVTPAIAHHHGGHHGGHHGHHGHHGQVSEASGGEGTGSCGHLNCLIPSSD